MNDTKHAGESPIISVDIRENGEMLSSEETWNPWVLVQDGEGYLQINCRTEDGKTIHKKNLTCEPPEDIQNSMNLSEMDSSIRESVSRRVKAIVARSAVERSAQEEEAWKRRLTEELKTLKVA